MQTTRQTASGNIVTTREYCCLTYPELTQPGHKNMLAQLSYTGFKFPQSQWAALIKQPQCITPPITDIGHIRLQASGVACLQSLEQKLLSMARNHGAHMVRIDMCKITRQCLHHSDNQQYSIFMYARCQRLQSESIT